MKIDVTPGKITAWLGIPAAIAGAILAWDLVGWTTPKAHNADLEQHEVAQASVSTAILTQLQLNRDEWWCDEEGEYLDDLLEVKDSGDTSAWIEQEILEQRTKMEATECHRFDKD